MKPLLFLVVFVSLLMLSGFVRMMFPADVNFLIYGLLGCGSAYLTVFLFLKIERKSWSAFGFAWDRLTLWRFLLGTGIGLLLMGAIIFPLVLFTALEIRFQPDNFEVKSLLAILSILPLALMEEIGFRSYPQIVLNDKYGVWISQFLMATVFALYHILNGWSLTLSFTGPFIWAFAFGLSAIWSGGTSMPTGIHFGLNLVQSLLGLKAVGTAVWKLDYPSGTPISIMGKTNTVALYLHGIALVFFLVLTYLYYRSAVTKAISCCHK